MKNDTITYYNLALRDVKTSSIPHRKENGDYQCSNGQISILKPHYKELASLSVHLNKLKIERCDILNEIISYEEPYRQLLANNCANETDDEIKRIIEKKATMQQEQQQLEEDMNNRGVVFEDELQNQGFENVEITEETNQDKSDDKVSAKEGNNSKLKHILQFIVLWLTGEIFLTAIQWSVLRDEKSLEDMIVRSFAFGVCLGLFHFISYKNKNEYRWEYVAFLAVSLTMIFSMLFGPLFINTLYPITNAVDIANSWDLSGGQGRELTEYPIWIEVYRRYDVVIPSAITFFAFLIMESFLKEKSSKDIAPIAVDSKPLPRLNPKYENSEKENFDNPIRNRFRLLKKSIMDADLKIENLEKIKHERLKPNTANLYVIEEKITKLKNRVLEIEDEIHSLTNHIYSLINELFSQLEKYRTDFIDILRNDIKADLIKTDWPNEEDIFIYFKLNRHE